MQGPRSPRRFSTSGANSHSSAAGKVFLVGAGPGDPDLLTVKAARLLAAADVIVYDNLVGDGVMDLVGQDVRRIYVGKEAGHHALPQDDINRLLVRLGREGLRVVRLKGGDPFIFGRGGEERAALLEAGVACEVVPGITAAAGAASTTGIPLTHRSHAQTLVLATGHLQDGSVNLDWPTLARPRQTVVIYMGLGALPVICERLLAHGMPASTPAAVIQSATTAQQTMVSAPLDELPAAVAAAGLQPPALIMIGEVVALEYAASRLAAELQPA